MLCLWDEDVVWRQGGGARRGSKGRSIFLLFPPCIQMDNYTTPHPPHSLAHTKEYNLVQILSGVFHLIAVLFQYKNWRWHDNQMVIWVLRKITCKKANLEEVYTQALYRQGGLGLWNSVITAILCIKVALNVWLVWYLHHPLRWLVDTFLSFFNGPLIYFHSSIRLWRDAQ